MVTYASRSQDAAEKVKQAQLDVERATARYRAGAGCEVINKANRKLADAHAEYQRVIGGRADDR